jgi:hypothetical protein
MDRDPVRLVELCSPQSEPDLLLLKSILGDAGIDFFVENDSFGSLTLGPSVTCYNRKKVLVPEDQWEDAATLLRSLEEGPQLPPPPQPRPLDRLVATFQALFSSMISAGPRRDSRPELQLIKSPPAPPQTPARRGSSPGPRPELRQVWPPQRPPEPS